jgi:hypothetical protein
MDNELDIKHGDPVISYESSVHEGMSEITGSEIQSCDTNNDGENEEQKSEINSSPSQNAGNKTPKIRKKKKLQTANKNSKYCILKNICTWSLIMFAGLYFGYKLGANKDISEELQQSRNIGYGKGYNNGKITGFDTGRRVGFDEGYMEGRFYGITLANSGSNLF